MTELISLIPLVRDFLPFLKEADFFLSTIIILAILVIVLSGMGMHLTIKQKKINRRNADRYIEANRFRIALILILMAILCLMKALSEVL